jgi:aminoglycoside phosphotransferase
MPVFNSKFPYPLKGKLPVPEVLHFEQYENTSFLLMREVSGDVGYVYYQEQHNPKKNDTDLQRRH